MPGATLEEAYEKAYPRIRRTLLLAKILLASTPAIPATMLLALRLGAFDGLAPATVAAIVASTLPAVVVVDAVALVLLRRAERVLRIIHAVRGA